MTDSKFTVVIELTTDQMTALLEQCRKEQRTVQDVSRSAIAHYIQHRDLVEFNTAKALAD